MFLFLNFLLPSLQMPVVRPRTQPWISQTQLRALPEPVSPLIPAGLGEDRPSLYGLLEHHNHSYLDEAIHTPRKAIPKVQKNGREPIQTLRLLWKSFDSCLVASPWI
jgi:hypothetical protein